MPRVPAALLEELLCLARATRSAGGVPLEILFHLAWTAGWRLTLPPQWGTPTRVHVLPASAGGPAPLIEVHSHHGMPAFWSATDDADEVGLALYAVLGRIFDQPQLCVRLGIYGQWWPLPAATVFELPAIIQATYAGEWPCQSRKGERGTRNMSGRTWRPHPFGVRQARRPRIAPASVH